MASSPRVPQFPKKFLIAAVILIVLFRLLYGGIFSTTTAKHRAESNFHVESRVPADPEETSTNTVQIMGPAEIQSLDQLDPKLSDYIRDHHILHPAVVTQPYQLGSYKVPKAYDAATDALIEPLFKDKRGGFFVEVGANDGIRSHTLYMEKEKGWKGLLIECHPSLVPTLKAVKRKAYICDLCLSRGKHPDKAQLTSLDKHLASSSMVTGPKMFPKIQSKVSTFEVQTVPLYSILAAINVTEIDYFVLDIQSLEEDVLHNFPFDRVHVKVWQVEVYFLSAEKRAALRVFMEKQGYSKDRFWQIRPTGYTDYIFVHESFKPETT